MKHLYYQLLTLVVFTCFLSCSQSEDPTYSCNKAENEWVKRHLSEIRTMSRAEWNYVDEGLKIPVYRAFTHQQRLDFWVSKFTDVLSLDWSDAEKQHISSLLETIKEHTNYLDGYENLSEAEKDEFDLFFYKWIEKSKEEFQWSKELIQGMIASGNTLLDKKGNLAISKNRMANMSYSESSTCNCSLSNDWCTPSNVYCEAVSCEETFLGCGTILAYNCTGRCGGI